MLRTMMGTEELLVISRPFGCIGQAKERLRQAIHRFSGQFRMGQLKMPHSLHAFLNPFFDPSGL
jgi:hypothetical protein